jgi:hypothetical protein
MYFKNVRFNQNTVISGLSFKLITVGSVLLILNRKFDLNIFLGLNLITLINGESKSMLLYFERMIIQPIERSSEMVVAILWLSEASLVRHNNLLSFNIYLLNVLSFTISIGFLRGALRRV